jgi:mRNA interferase MazF
MLSSVVTTHTNEKNNYITLATLVEKAIGYRTIGQFIDDCQMVDSQMIEKILNKKLCEYPYRSILHIIANNSYRKSVSVDELYTVCGYSKNDPEEFEMMKGFFPKRGDIYYVDLGMGYGSEQGGIRPFIVVSNDAGNERSGIVVGIPVSTKKKTFTKTHVYIPKEYGLKEDSFALTEQIKCIDKRRLFYNGLPWRVSSLAEWKMQEIQSALEIELGFENIYFNEEKAFQMINHIKSLHKNIKLKQSKDLIGLFEEKVKEFKNYCLKYKKDTKIVMSEYDRINKISCAV